MIYTSHSAQETQVIAEKLAEKFKHQGGVIALHGELGAGKTTFVQGLAKGLKLTNKILSPTFITIRQYPLPDRNRLLVHADLYRLKDNLNLIDVGLADYLHIPQNIVIIEWPEKLASLPQRVVSITIDKISDTERSIIIEDRKT